MLCGIPYSGSEASKDGPDGHGHGVPPRDGSTDGDVVSRVWTRFGTFAAKYAGGDAPAQIDEVVQATLGITEQDELTMSM